MSRLAAPCRRNGFVILQAVHSLPVALHPASLRRSYLQLHVLRLHIGWTLTLLTRQHHRRTHSRERGNPEPGTRGKVWMPAYAGMILPHAVGSAVDNHHPSPANQQVSSTGPSIRNDRTVSRSPLANAELNRRPPSSSCGPEQGMNQAGDMKWAGQAKPCSGRLIMSMPPTAPTAWSGKTNLPFGRKASSQLQLGWLMPAQT